VSVHWCRQREQGRKSSGEIRDRERDRICRGRRQVTDEVKQEERIEVSMPLFIYWMKGLGSRRVLGI
jgi:hypothetical protein